MEMTSESAIREAVYRLAYPDTLADLIIKMPADVVRSMCEVDPYHYARNIQAGWWVLLHPTPGHNKVSMWAEVERVIDLWQTNHRGTRTLILRLKGGDRPTVRTQARFDEEIVALTPSQATEAGIANKDEIQ